MPVLRGLTVKTPNPRSSMRSPAMQGLLHAVEYGVNRRFCFGPWQSGTLNNPLYKILLNHLGRRPWAVIFRKMVLTGFSNVMVESRSEIVNDRTLP